MLEPVGVDVLETPQLARPEQFLNGFDGGMVNEQVPHHEQAALPPGGLQHGAAIFRRQRERLLDEYVLARIQRGNRHGGMFLGRRGDGYGVDLRIRQYLFESAEHPRSRILRRPALRHASGRHRTNREAGLVDGSYAPGSCPSGHNRRRRPEHSHPNSIVS